MTLAVVRDQETSTPPPSPARTINETLCAAAHLVEGFADYVEFIVNGPPEVCAPASTEDPVALQRHAALARRTRRRRDLALSLIMLSVVILEAGSIAHRHNARAAALVIGAAIVAWTGRGLLRRPVTALGRWIWKNRWSAGLVWALVASAALSLLVREAMLWCYISPLIGGLVASWLVIVGESVVAHGRAAAILASGAPPPRDLAPRLSRWREERAAESATTNVLVYGHRRATAPFIGSGNLVKRPFWMDVDVRQGRRDHTGREITPKAFDIIALHRHLEERFALQCAVESNAFRTLSSGHRLVVNGDALHRMPDLLDSEGLLPRAHVDWDFLTEELHHPERADHRRVFFHLQESRRRGEISVSHYVQPRLSGSRLAIELTPLVVLPVLQAIPDELGNVRRRLHERITRAVRTCTPRTPATLAGAPLAVAADVIRQLINRSAWLSARVGARLGIPPNVGTEMSVREGTSWREMETLDSFVVSDLISMNDHLQKWLIGELTDYLRGLGIDTSSLKEAFTINNIQNWNVGNVRADIASFGNDNTFKHGSGEGAK